MLTAEIDKSSKIPLYEQLYAMIRKQIETGAFSAGEKLPSKRKLALHLEISQSTIERAYAQLDAEGYIRSTPRSGYFVSELEPLEIAPGTAAEIRPDPIKKIPRTGLLPGQSILPYDMRINAVDGRHFPYSVWRKLQRKSIESDDEFLLRQNDSAGNAALREAIAHYLFNFKGMRVTPEHIVLGAGTEYLFGLLMDLLGVRRVVVEDPGNATLKRILRIKGIHCIPIPLDEEGLDYWRVRAYGAEAVITMPAYQFPSGITMSVNRKRQFLSWLSEYPTRYLIEDDFDSEFRHALRPVPSLYSMGQDANIIYMNSFTRTIAPSLRIAYMILPETLYMRYLKDMDFYHNTVSEFEQRTLARFMAEGYFERHVMRMRKVYRRRRDILSAALSDLFASDGFSVEPPACGLVFKIQARGMTEEEMIWRAATKGVRLYPASAYYSAAEVQTQEAISNPHNCAAPADCPEATESLPTVLAGFAGLTSEALVEAGNRLTAALLG